MAQRLIVIGGDAAGMSAASAARRQLPEGELEIVAFERGHYTSYSACGIPYLIGKHVADASELVILGLGVIPNTTLAAGAGIPLGETGAIAVDRRLRTGIEGVWAGGHCVEKFHRVSRRHVALPLGTHANKEGRTAGINLGGGYATFPGVLGTAVTKICDIEAGRTGLGEAEAQTAGFDPITAVVDSTTRAGYYPGAKPIRTKPIAERGTGRLLGAQIVGEEGAAKRIDVLSVTLWHETPAEELLNIDLSYAPPFSPVWDPVLIAARKTWQVVETDRARTEPGRPPTPPSQAVSCPGTFLYRGRPQNSPGSRCTVRIGEAAAAAGMTTKALRFYEQHGLLPPVHRGPNGYRDYPPETLARMQFIRRSKTAGLSLAEIRNILQIRDAGQAPCAHVAAQLAQQLTDLDQHIAELTALRTFVAEHYQAASQGDPAQCNAEQICSYL